ncbi:MAG: hypothetical protein AAFZ15_07545 [Bacteroidota bacterium]
MKKKFIKRTITSVLLTLFVGVAGIVTLVLHPQVLFAHQLEHRHFSIYSEVPINENIKQILDSAERMVMSSELHDAGYKYDIFLCHGTAFNKLDDWLLGSWPAARAIDNNVIIKVPVDIGDGTAENGENEFHLDYMFAHEMVHCLQANHYGKLTFNPLSHPPMWKLEGYPEYISRQKRREPDNYNLMDEINLFLEKTNESSQNIDIIQLDRTTSVPYIYFKGRLMVEYLMDIKNWSYDDILQEKIKEEQVWKELLEWHQNEIEQ